MIVFCYRFISQINSSFRAKSFIASLLPPTLVWISMQKWQSNVVLRLLCCYHAQCIHNNSPFLGTLPPTPNQIHPLSISKKDRSHKKIQIEPSFVLIWHILHRILSGLEDSPLFRLEEYFLDQKNKKTLSVKEDKNCTPHNCISSSFLSVFPFRRTNSHRGAFDVGMP